jgi:hypothetical protein
MISAHTLHTIMNPQAAQIEARHLEKIKEYYNVLHSSSSYDDGFGCQAETNFIAKHFDGRIEYYNSFENSMRQRCRAMHKNKSLKDLSLEQLCEIGGDL